VIGFPHQQIGTKFMTNLPRASAIRETLQKLPDLEAAMRGRVVKALIGGGYAVDDLMSEHLYASDAARTPLPPISAAASQPRKFAEVSGLCRSLGFHINAADSKPIDVAAMDKAFAGKDIEQRARAKFALYQLGLIPA
jgi:hypothetical protein